MIYIKTERGKTALQNRSSMLTSRQRPAFIMFDGKRSAEEVLRATSGFGFAVADIEQMVELGLIEPVLAQTLAPSEASASRLPLTPESHSSFASSALPSVLPALVPAGNLSVTLPPAGTSSLDATPSLDAQAHFLKAWPIATRLTANLGLRGFRLNLAVESAADLTKLKELAPRIKDAVGSEKFRELEIALYE